MTKLEAALSKLDRGTREDFDERAGILEFDGGMSREDAEREAWRIVVAPQQAARAPKPQR